MYVYTNIHSTGHFKSSSNSIVISPIVNNQESESSSDLDSCFPPCSYSFDFTWAALKDQKEDISKDHFIRILETDFLSETSLPSIVKITLLLI